MKSQLLRHQRIQAVRLPKEHHARNSMAYALYVAFVIFVIVYSLRAFDQPVGAQQLSISDTIANRAHTLEAAIDAATR
jgi:hypothetical protein